VPFAITVDYDVMENSTVTVRERDSMAQVCACVCVHMQVWRICECAWVCAHWEGGPQLTLGSAGFGPAAQCGEGRVGECPRL